MGLHSRLALHPRGYSHQHRATRAHIPGAGVPTRTAISQCLFTGLWGWEWGGGLYALGTQKVLKTPPCPRGEEDMETKQSRVVEC